MSIGQFFATFFFAFRFAAILHKSTPQKTAGYMGASFIEGTMNQRSHQNTRWNYFLALERDLETISRYIELNQENYSAYSIELARLLMAACAELDVLFKDLCWHCNVDSEPSNISHYTEILFKKYPELNHTTLVCPRYGLIFKPFSDWSKSSSPSWWAANNKVKHKRDTYFHLANLGNCLDAIAALFWVNVQSNYQMHYHYARSLDDHVNPPDLTHTFKTLVPSATLLQLNDPWMYLSD
jgi:hypothetical protein